MAEFPTPTIQNIERKAISRTSLLKCLVGLHDLRYLSREGPRYCCWCGYKQYLTSEGWRNGQQAGADRG